MSSVGESVIHVKATCDAGTSQRLGSAILQTLISDVVRYTMLAMGYFGPHIHESWHFMLQGM